MIQFLIIAFCFSVNLLDSYDDTQVKYEWTNVHLREHDMTEFYVEKQFLRLEYTSFITGTSGLFVNFHTITYEVFKKQILPQVKLNSSMGALLYMSEPGYRLHDDCLHARARS